MCTNEISKKQQKVTIITLYHIHFFFVITLQIKY